MVHYERRGNIALLVVDHPPVNALSPGVPEGLQAAVERANQDPDVNASAVMGAGRTFMAGADIKELTKPDVSAYLKSLLDCERAIEDSPKPVVMAMHGTAFGAGLETAMAGHYRIISSMGQVGQPEVKLGLIPGAGGTQRLPRLVGMEQALEMCVFGEPVSAQQALAWGLVDELFEGDVAEAAVVAARKIVGRKFVKTRERGEKVHTDAFAIMSWTSAQRDNILRKLPGETAPARAVSAIAATTRMPFYRGLKWEHDLFEECRRGPQSKALIHLFFAERSASKVPDVTAEAKASPTPAIVVHSLPAEPTKDGVICLERSGSRLCEIIRGAQATPEVIKTALVHAKKQGKVAVVVREAVSERLLRIWRQTENINTLAEEGAAILAEGGALRASDIDVISVLACGFPAWRGGVMYCAANGEGGL